MFYTIYRNSKFFVGNKYRNNGIISGYRSNFKLSPSKFDSTTSRDVINLPRTCENGLLQTDGRVVSATAMTKTTKGYQILHNYVNNEKSEIMVNIKYSQDHVSISVSFNDQQSKITDWCSITW